MSWARWILTATLLVTLESVARAQTSYPMVSRVEPTAVQRGTTIDVTITGAGNFAGAWKILSEGQGLTAEVIVGESSTEKKEKTPSDKTEMKKPTGSVKARLVVADDSPLGPRELRVATPQGVSSVGVLVVVDSPVVVEGDDKANDQPAQAQILPIPATATGLIGKTEDVDWYAFEAKAGERITFRVWGNRLENKIHDLQTHFDPILQLHDGAGRELVADDNHNFADPLLSYEFNESGRYLLQIRDTTYAGDASWAYVLEATAGPYASSVFPLAVNPGTTAELHARGFNFDPEQTLALEVPKDLPRGPWLSPLPTSSGPTLTMPLLVTSLPVTIENGESAGEAGKVPRSLSVPTALCGRLGVANEADTYSFQAHKGQAFSFEVISRRVGAAADPVLRILDAKGATLAEADDTFGKDPRLEWTAPADGPFRVQINDLHSRGGENFGYVLEVEPANPDFVLTCDPDKLNLGPDSRIPVFVQLTRRNGFNGPVTVEWEGLPAGIDASPLTIPTSMTQGVMVVSAVADAKPVATLVTIKGQAETTDGPVVRVATPKQEIYVPGGGRGFYAVNTLALVVTDTSDIRVEAKPATIALTPGGSATLEVSVTRRPDFDKAVNLAVILQHLGGVHGNPLPPGVVVAASGNKTLLGPKETEGKIVLQAKPDAAPCDSVPIAVMGHVSINFVVKTAYASEPIRVSVLPKNSPATVDKQKEKDE